MRDYVDQLMSVDFIYALLLLYELLIFVFYNVSTWIGTTYKLELGLFCNMYKNKIKKRKALD